MRKCLYGILAAVFLSIWNAEETFANNEYLRYFEPFYLYQEADMYYNKSGAGADRLFNLQKNAEKYADNHPHQLVSRDYMIRQHVYISISRRKYWLNTPEVGRALTMLNVFLTLEAYEAAVSFRVCAFFYSYVVSDSDKQEACSNLSSYLEWYFSFMLEEKAQDLCRIQMFFPEEQNSPLKAENMCKILRKLNMNFMRFPGEQRIIKPLPHNKYNVFNPFKLNIVDSNRRRSFISIFENYQIPQKLENQTSDEYYEMVYYDLWNSVMAAYTEKYFELSRYLFEVTEGLPYPGNKPAMSTISFFKIIADYAPQLSKIITLPTQTPRGVVWYLNEGNIESNIGSVIHRSNAVEILRQISCHYFLPTPTNAGLMVYVIIKIINSSNVKKCRLEPAPKELSVDYVFQINTTEIMPLLSLN